MSNDLLFMAAALEEARKAVKEGNTPFGAAVVRGDQLIARGHNVVQSEQDPTAHGEVQAIRAACRDLGTISLEGTTLYTTCEPCLMCTGAIIAAKIAKVVIGARWTDAPQYFDQSKPSLLSVGGLVKYPFSHTLGVMREECVKLYQPDQ